MKLPSWEFLLRGLTAYIVSCLERTARYFVYFSPTEFRGCTFFLACLKSPFANRVLPLFYGDDHDGSLVVDTIPSFDSSQCDNQSFPFHCRVVIDKMWIETVDYLKMATPEIKTLEH